MDTANSILFVLGLLLALANIITIMDYWWGTKPMMNELWGRRVLGDDVYTRCTATKPKPPTVRPLPEIPPIVVSSLSVPIPNRIVVETPKTWPLLEVTKHGIIYIRGANNRATRVTNVAQISREVSNDETADTRPPWED